MKKFVLFLSLFIMQIFVNWLKKHRKIEILRKSRFGFDKKARDSQSERQNDRKKDKKTQREGDREIERKFE